MTKFAIDNIGSVGGIREDYCMQLLYLIIKLEHYNFSHFGFLFEHDRF
jgi:hypothetical protein